MKAAIAASTVLRESQQTAARAHHGLPGWCAGPACHLLGAGLIFWAKHGLSFLKFAGFAALAVALEPGQARAHDIGGDEDHPHYDFSVAPPGANGAAQAGGPAQPAGAANWTAGLDRPFQAEPFARFAPKVRTHWDDRFLFIESDGLPAHPMMIGITAWQQQTPIPQPYIGENAWRIPLHPAAAQRPLSIRGRFLRGAIAIAANGIPIFNPQNNRGEISQEIGELDRWGGHCGRADDYHYHAAPLHLQAALGDKLPIAFALDGYPIYGLKEPDGSRPASLDVFNGHDRGAAGYHYHASTNYPYVNGGFHGQIVERDGQADPQPRAQPIRRDQPPLRGARITGFNMSADQTTFALFYSVDNKPAEIHYQFAGNGAWIFRYRDADGSSREETYRAGKTPSPSSQRPPNRRPRTDIGD